MLEFSICYSISELIQGQLYLCARKQGSLISWLGSLHPGEPTSRAVCASGTSSQALSQANRQGREQQSTSPRQPLGLWPWLSFRPGWGYLAMRSGRCLSTNSCMLWCSVDFSRKTRNDWTYLSRSAIKLLMGEAMLAGCRKGQAAPCSSSLRARERMKSGGGENPACTWTLLHVPGPATASERYTTLQ